ncbi:eCIS core domain-containing protein [Catenuloplanes indicus]|uniref:eCIS core domain-containing protein n=1 Tax=Catenuloplanes indicus TaxID=137267 RepID=A0AAE3VW51_9ACTN|nr:DUF4157 domain-containing protein [Catenuloplanes indicus]MDQ0364105.1 hypothetical protein [Catenuloplanes indicus]
MSGPAPARATAAPKDGRGAKRGKPAAGTRVPRELREMLSAPGRPVEPGVRREMEARLGFDFGRVLVHADRDAAAVTDLVGAEAVTVGQDIFFAEGRYRPGTAEGVRLLAHELLHTVQAPDSPGALLLGRDAGAVSRAVEPIEREAESIAAGTVSPAGVEAHGQAGARWLRYASQRADLRRGEALDPATLIDRIAAGLQRSLRGDPADASGRVRLQLARLAPELRYDVLERLENRLPSSEFTRVTTLAEEADAAPGDGAVEFAGVPAPVTDPESERRDERDDTEESAESERQQHEQREAEGEDPSGLRQPGTRGPETEGPETRTESDGGTATEPGDQTDTETGGSRPGSEAHAEPPAEETEPDGSEPEGEVPTEDEAEKKTGEEKAEAEEKAKHERDEKDEKERQDEGRAAEGDQQPGSGAPGAQPDAAAAPVAGAGAPAAAGPVGDGAAGGVGEAAEGRADTIATDPNGPLTGHNVLEQPDREADPEELPLGLESDTTDEPGEDATPSRSPVAPELDLSVAPDERPPADAPAAETPDFPELADLRRGAGTPEEPRSVDPGAARALAVTAHDYEVRRDDTEPLTPAADRPEAAANAPQPVGRAETRERAQDAAIGADDVAPGQLSTPDEQSETVAAPLAEESVTLSRSDANPEPAPMAGGGATTEQPDTTGAALTADLADGSPTAAPAGAPMTAETSGAPTTTDIADTTGGELPQDASLEPGGGGCAGAPEPTTEGDGESGGGCGGGGGVPPAAAEEEPQGPSPADVVGMEPSAALTAAAALPPHQMQTALTGVDAAATRTVGEEEGALAAAPPMMERPSGAPQTLQGPPVAAPPAASDVGRLEQVRPEGAEGQEGPQTRDVPAGALPTSQVSSPAVAGTPEGELTDEDLGSIEDAVDNVPTTDPALTGATVGPAPRVELAGETDPALTDRQTQALTETSGRLATVGREDAGRPLGEDRVFPDVPPESLQANVPAPAGGGQPAAGPAPGGGAGAPAGVPMTAVSVVAQQERGPQIQASVGEGQAQMAAGAQQKEQDAAQAHQQHQADVAATLQENVDAQASERQRVSVEAAAQREQWQSEQDTLLLENGEQAAAEHTTARTDISTEERDANDEIEAERETHNEDIAEERREAEEDAREEKEKGKEQDGGFWGWVKSKVAALFDAIVSAVKAVFEAARRAVQGLIDAFKSIATGLIEAARRAIVAAINVLATALIAIADVLLAAFPELRDRFRSAIEGLRDRAINAVNELADRLKTGIEALLDLLAAGLMALLSLYETLLLAAVQVVRTMVESAIAFAQAAIAALGMLAELIADIAPDPIGWLGKLGTAAKEGTRQHLWGEIKIAVKAWFNAKVQSILGLGKMLFDVLVKGCVSAGQIGRMAWQAIIKSLPMMIATIIIEKLISMIIPAAGAVMAIAQGLVAAYQSISQIIAAFAKFFEFLKAVKGGNAACLFAQAMAAGVVALLEFVTNFLMVRLGMALKGVATKLKGIAQKIMKGLRRGARSSRRAAGRAVNSARRGLRQATRSVSAAGRRGGRSLGNARRAVVSRVRRAGRVLRQLGGPLRRSRVGRALTGSVRDLRARFDRTRHRATDRRTDRHRRSEARKNARLTQAMNAATAVANRYSGRKIAAWLIRPRLLLIQGRYLLNALRTRRAGQRWSLFGRINPSQGRDTGALVLTNPGEAVALFIRRALAAERRLFGTDGPPRTAGDLRGPPARLPGAIPEAGPGLSPNASAAPGSQLLRPEPLATTEPAVGEMLRGVVPQQRQVGLLGSHRPWDITGLPQAEVIRTQLRAQELVGPLTGRLQMQMGSTRIHSELRDTPDNLGQAHIGHVGDYTRSIPAKIAKLRERLGGGVIADADLVDLWRHVSSTGDPATPQMLRQLGSRATTNQLQTAANNLNRIVLLGGQEATRFLRRGFNAREHQPVATATALTSEQIRAGRLPAETLISTGEMPSQRRGRTGRSNPAGVRPPTLRPSGLMLPGTAGVNLAPFSPVGITRQDVLAGAIVARAYLSWNAYKQATSRALALEAQQRGESIVYLVPSEADLVMRLRAFYGTPRAP